MVTGTNKKLFIKSLIISLCDRLSSLISPLSFKPSHWVPWRCNTAFMVSLTKGSLIESKFFFTVAVPQLNVSYKPQKISPKSQGTVRMLLHAKIRDSYIHPQFIADVIKPLQIENIYDQEVCFAVLCSWVPLYRWFFPVGNCELEKGVQFFRFSFMSEFTTSSLRCYLISLSPCGRYTGK